MGVTGALTLAELERDAERAFDAATWAYVSGGAGTGSVITANRRAFDRVALLPGILGRCDIAPPALGISLFGRSFPLPVLLAPTSPQALLHARAELETAAGANASGIGTIVSTDSHYPFREIAGATDADCWFQLYCYRSRRDIEATIDYAIQSGARAIVLTADANFAARRIAASRAGFSPPQEIDLGTLRALGLFDGALPREARLERVPLGWKDLAWIRDRTPLPLLIKGVLRADDAERCIDHGADGVIVSNHGGRQLDGAIAALDALPAIVSAVGAERPVLLDGGVRTGADIVRALALGAAAVCIGRPYLWGLGLNGAAGVAHVVELLRADLADTLLQLGLGSVAEISKACISHARADIADEPRPMRDRHAVLVEAY